MKEGQASRTAEYVALFRAIESSLPAKRRLFEDPFARRFLGRRFALLAALCSLPGAADLVSRYIDGRWAGARSSAVARTRLIDDTISEALAQGIEQLVILGAGFDARTFILWEGVTNYLTEAAVDGTLRWCAQAASGSQLLFSYVHRAVLDDSGSFAGTETLFATLKQAGEQWTFGLDPTELADFLRKRGLKLEHDIGSSEYRARYLPQVSRIMRGYEFYRIAIARVPQRNDPQP